MRIPRTVPPAATPIALADVCRGLAAMFPGSRSVVRLQSEIKASFGVRHVFLVSSGKAALYLILRALKSLSLRRRVIIPAYTCHSVPSAIVKAGLTLDLCDIDPATFDFDPLLLERTINHETLCVIPNHLFGIPSDIDRVAQLCRERGAFVVEDAAQAMGGQRRGMMLGTIGAVGFFSLGRGKNITCGGGGIILTNSTEIAAAIGQECAQLPHLTLLETIRDFLEVAILSAFIRPWLYWFPAALPFLKLGQTIFYKDFPVKALSSMKAGLLHGWPEKLKQFNRIRAEAAAYYARQLRLEPTVDPSVSYLRLPYVAHTPHLRDWIHGRSRQRGLGISAMYPCTVAQIPELMPSFNGKRFPAAEDLAERLLTFPTHQFASDRDKTAICDLIQSAPRLAELSREGQTGEAYSYH